VNEIEDYSRLDAYAALWRPPPNGFVLATESGDAPFYPGKLGPSGPETNPAMKDEVDAFIGLLGLCRKTPTGLFECVAVKRDGSEVVIPQPPMLEQPL
jgi:hypothetical protein